MGIYSNYIVTSFSSPMNYGGATREWPRSSPKKNHMTGVRLDHSLMFTYNIWLIGGFNPSEKYLSQGRIIPYVMENILWHMNVCISPMKRYDEMFLNLFYAHQRSKLCHRWLRRYSSFFVRSSIAAATRRVFSSRPLLHNWTCRSEHSPQQFSADVPAWQTARLWAIIYIYIYIFVLYCIILYYIVLYCIILYYIVLYCIILY